MASAANAMAERRAKMANSSRTLLAGEQLDLKTGDAVEIYRQHGKDRPTLVGPAHVTDLSQFNHGVIGVRWQNRHYDIPIKWIRRALVYFVDDLSCFPYGNIGF